MGAWKKIWITMLNNRQISLMRSSAYIIGILTSSGCAPSRVDMNYMLKNVTK